MCVICFFGCLFVCCFFFFKQKTAYEMCGRDWSSDVCSSDLQLCTLLFSCLCCVVVESSKTSISSIHNFLISPDEELMQFVLSSCACILLLWWQGYLQIIVIEQKISKILHHILFVVLHRWYRTDCSQRPRNCSQSGADTKLCAWCRLRSSCLSLCRSPPAAYGTRNLMWKLLEPSGTEAS